MLDVTDINHTVGGGIWPLSEAAESANDAHVRAQTQAHHHKLLVRKKKGKKNPTPKQKQSNNKVFAVFFSLLNKQS